MANSLERDIIIIGGSLGGVLSAYQSLSLGNTVILTEETNWIGGQLTSQGVPPDEHKWIESFGCTKSYREYRNKVRQHYVKEYGVKESVNKDKLNPGNCWVSRIGHEPNVAHKILVQLIKPFIESNKLKILLNYKPIKATTIDNKIIDVTVENYKTKDTIILKGKIFVDGTDCGDLYPIVKEEYNIGCDGYDFKKEALSEKISNPYDMQPITWVAALEKLNYNVPPIKKPDMYEFYKQYITPYGKNLLGSFIPNSKNKKQPKRMNLFNGELPLWSYRRVFDPSLFDIKNKNEISLINWPQNDYFFGNIIENDKDYLHKEKAKELTLSLIYWLQTEAINNDGTKGITNLRLNGDVLGTLDGLAQYPYIREGRRLNSKFIVSENDICSKNIKSKSAKFSDSVGVGYYHMDFHITTVTNKYMYAKPLPFEIPLGIFISNKFTNLIPASKNVGTTQITNSCFRVHPVEWNIGEVSGILASYCIKNNISTEEVYKDKVEDFQRKLIKQGIQLHWDEELI